MKMKNIQFEQVVPEYAFNAQTHVPLAEQVPPFKQEREPPALQPRSKP